MKYSSQYRNALDCRYEMTFIKIIKRNIMFKNVKNSFISIGHLSGYKQKLILIAC